MTKDQNKGSWKNLMLVVTLLALALTLCASASAVMTTTKIQFIVNDFAAPVINESSTLPQSGTQYNQTDIVPLLIDSSENSTVIANISWDSTSQLVNLTYNGTQWYYNGTFNDTLWPGLYNVTYNVTDTSGNSNTTKTNFTVNDITTPTVTNITPAADTNYAAGTTVTITANVADSYYDSVDTVLANVTWDSTYETLVMTDPDSDGIYNVTFTNTTELYDFNVTIIANDTSSNINNTETTNFSTSDIIPPSLENVSFYPKVVITGRNVSINASATDNVAVDGVFANITLPNGTVRLVSLFANYTTEITGRYNVTIFANDTSGNINYTTDYFIVADPINITITVFDGNISAITVNLTIYLQDTDYIVDFEEIIGNVTKEEPAYYYDLFFEAYDNNITVLLRDVFLPLDDNETLGIEFAQPPATGYIATYGINTSFTFTTARIAISYAGMNYSDENNLRLDACYNWDFLNNTCTGTWQETNALQDTAEDTFALNVSSLSAFAIREITAAAGGHGGGAPPTPEVPECIEDWICSQWSECAPDNATTRMCVDWNNCGTEEHEPVTEKECAFRLVTMIIPEEPVIELPLELKIRDSIAFLLFVLIILGMLFALIISWNRMMYPPELGRIEFLDLEELLPIDEDRDEEKSIIRKFEVEKVSDFKEIIHFARHGPTVNLINIKKMIHNLDDLKKGVRILKKTIKATGGDIAGLRNQWIVATSHGIKIHKDNFVKEVKR